MHEEEDEEGYEEPQRHHLEVLEGRPAGPAASAEYTQEGDEQGDLGKGKFFLISAYFALEASSGLRTCTTCFCIFLFKQAKENEAMRRVHGRWFSEELQYLPPQDRLVSPYTVKMLLLNCLFHRVGKTHRL